MFRGGQPNPYDEIVAKTTDENLTSENWELILNLCDKVVEEGETGARNVVAAILKRLMHRMSNVQLYTLTLAESLVKNCGLEVHREVASRAFTQGLEKLITDRNTHEKVRQRALGLVAEWSTDFEKDPTLGVMEECYTNLKGKGYKFEVPHEAPPPDADEVLRRQEEEELQRVLEMSMHDKGGRGQWGEYSLAQSSGAGASVGSANRAPASNATRPVQAQQPLYGGYVPSASPAVSAENTSASVAASVAAPTPVQPAPTPYVAPAHTSPAPSIKSQDSSVVVVTRVRALHAFEPTEAGELAFEKGDIIKVVDRGYRDWWRGQLKGRTGIFPVNYVEPLPEPTAAELSKEAEQEASVFSQASNVDRLLQMLRQMDPAKDNLADNEEIQELYRSCMSLRPKIVKLIDKYSQKRADLVSMNETFVKARTIFDQMMEESLARHTSAGYDPRAAYGPSPYPRPDSRAPGEYGQPQAFGWNAPVYDQPGYPAYPGPAIPYGHGPEQGYPPQSYVDPTAYQQQPPPAPGAYPPQPYGQPIAPASTPYGVPPSQPQQQSPAHTQVQHAPQSYPSSIPHQAPAAPPQAVSPHVESAQPYAQAQTQAQPQVGAQPPIQMQPQPKPQPQSQPPAQSQPPVQSQPPAQLQQQAQPASQPESQGQPVQVQLQHPQSGPPFVYDPNATYPDPNVQAWAQYYAQGGTDPTGSLYFISVPGVKEASPSSPSSGGQPDPTAQQPASQPQGYQLHDPGFQSPSIAPLNIHRGAQSNSPTHDYGNLPNQFAGLNVGGQTGAPGVGAPA